jgi:mevalonate kinase
MIDAKKPSSVDPETDDSIRDMFFKDYDVVARAPACIFLFGGHSVVYGHLGLYLPVPRYAYVGLKVDPSLSGLEMAEGNPLNWIRPEENLSSPNERDFAWKIDSHSALDEQNEKYIKRAYEIIRRRYFPPERQSLGLRMKVFCQAPTRSGLNSSGSIAAALVMALSTFFRDPINEEELAHARGKLNESSLEGEYLRESELFETLSTLGWFLDDCLHGLGGTAIGATGSLLGTENGLPLIFMTEARTGLSPDRSVKLLNQKAKLISRGRDLLSFFSHDQRHDVLDEVPRHPFNYKPYENKPGERLDRMAKVKRLIVRLDDSIGDGTGLPEWWDETGIAVVYGGDPKYTRDMLEKIGNNLGTIANRTFITDILHLAAARKMQLNPLESWLLQTSQPPEILDLNAWKTLTGAEKADNYAWRRQHRREAMMMLMGGTSYLGLEALYSHLPYEFAERLRHQQELFRVLGISRSPIDTLCQAFAAYQDESGRRPFGATITGGGGGGDVLVFGTRNALEQEFDAIYSSVRKSINDRHIQVHFRSWLEPSLTAEPAKVIYHR